MRRGRQGARRAQGGRGAGEWETGRESQREAVTGRGSHRVRWYLSDWLPPDLSCLQTVAHQYFWYHTTLNASNHMGEEVETLVLNLTLGIFTVWFLLFLIMMVGLKISMQVSHSDRRSHYPFTFARSRDPQAPFRHAIQLLPADFSFPILMTRPPPTRPEGKLRSGHAATLSGVLRKTLDLPSAVVTAPLKENRSSPIHGTEEHLRLTLFISHLHVTACGDLQTAL